MKKIRFILLAIFVMVGMSGFAQVANTDEAVKTAQIHIDTWSKYIPAVTDDQRKQMVSVETWFVNSANEARANNTDTNVLVSKVKALSDERNIKMKNILTPSQYSRYLQIFATEAK